MRTLVNGAAREALTMENGEKIPWNFLNWPSLVVFVLLSWGIVLLPPALVSKRPTGEAERLEGPFHENRFESRLWQDPFEVLAGVRREMAQAHFKPPCPETALCSVARKGKTLILAVFLRGESYTEEVESRLRSRYAVVSALCTAGYTADEAGDLGCLSVDGVTLQVAPPPVCPFELFTHKDSDTDEDRDHKDLVSPEFRQVKPPRNVAVVWVDERLLDETNVGSHPLVALKQFAKQLTEDLSPETHLALIGPYASDTLQALRSDMGYDTVEQCGNNAERTPIYSFASTVGALREPQTPSPLLEKYFELFYVIGTDRELAQSLRAELKLRGVDKAKEPAKIALVAEWDTYYGRSMIEEFSKEFRGGGAGNNGGSAGSLTYGESTAGWRTPLEVSRKRAASLETRRRASCPAANHW
jgi:hypothetical protein